MAMIFRIFIFFRRQYFLKFVFRVSIMQDLIHRFVSYRGSLSAYFLNGLDPQPYFYQLEIQLSAYFLLFIFYLLFLILTIWCCTILIRLTAKVCKFRSSYFLHFINHNFPSRCFEFLAFIYYVLVEFYYSVLNILFSV